MSRVINLLEVWYLALRTGKVHGISGVTTIGAGRAVAPPLFDGSKLEIDDRLANYSIQLFTTSRVESMHVPY